MGKDNTYMERTMDFKKIWLLYWQRVWLVVVITIAAAGIGAGVYNVVRTLNSEGELYRVSSDYYITFNEDENGVDYYNAYTWDSILRDDPVVDVVMEHLPNSVSKDDVKATVTGEMLSDYRILTVHATSKDPEFAELVAKAYIAGLSRFADKISMLDTIELWSQEAVTPVVEENLTGNAAILGAIAGLVLGVIIWSVYSILDDSFYVEKDFTNRFSIPFLGMITRKHSLKCRQELKENSAYLLKENEKYRLVFATKDGDSVDAAKIDVLKEMQSYMAGIADVAALQGESLAALRGSDGAVLMIPWGSKNGTIVEKTIQFLEKQDCKIVGAVIYDAEDAFIKKYYGTHKQ